MTVTAGTITVRRYSANGGMESINKLSIYDGIFYCEGIFTDSGGKLNLYGSTTGRFFRDGMNAVMLDWFYARLEY
jgi:hypothetical protein